MPAPPRAEAPPTRIVASLVDGSVDAMLARARASAADLVELRLDRLSDVDSDAIQRLAKGVDRPALATLRTVTDGGRFPADAPHRRELLLACVEAGIPYVDVEATAPFADEVLAHARDKGVRVVLSLHLPDTPRSGAIVAFLREAAQRGAWCGKLATGARDPDAVARLAEAAFAARRERIPFALMAVDDAWLRRLAPVVGSCLVYGSDGEAAAPGQVPVADLRREHAAFAAGATRAVALLGHPVAHSRSPAFQNAAFAAAGIDGAYAALDVAPERLASAVELVRTPAFLGANVTVPYKEAVLAHVDLRAPSAAATGAANVLVNEGGEVSAHNTDGEGALRALAEAGVDLAGAEALVHGAGGTARALVHALLEAGTDVAVTNRSVDRGAALATAFDVPCLTSAEAAKLLDAFDVVVNATTVGMQDDAVPFDVTWLHRETVVLDCVYRPGGTALGRAARARGLRLVPGETMLLHQGAASFTLWTGAPAPLDAMRAALSAAMEAA